LFRGKTVDVHNDSMVIEATGSPDKLEALLEMLRPYGVRELVQSGLVAMARGSKSLTDRRAGGAAKPSALTAGRAVRTDEGW
jgi:acetolactate synthase-1/3 small subunit